MIDGGELNDRRTTGPTGGESLNSRIEIEEQRARRVVAH